MTTTQQSAGPLDGVKVVDMTAVGMGPYATQILGDMGADVVKIETTLGDVFRFVTPQRGTNMSHPYLNLNRNKRSVILDAKTPEGKQAILDLVRDADVFVSNVRPQAMRRLGLDYEALRAVNERIIYCACYGYSEDGPYAGRAAVDDAIQAACGLAWIQGFGGDAPKYVNSIIIDKIVGLHVSQAITMALYSREKTGRGQAIEVPMFECATAFMMPEHLAGLTFEPPLGGAGYTRLLNPYRKPFRTQDGFIGVVPYTDPQWKKFFAIVGRPEMIEDPRYATILARSNHFSELYAFIETELAKRTTAEWCDLLADAELPFAPVNSIEALLDDPHLAAIGFWHETNHPTEGRVRMPGIPVKFSDTPGTIRRHAPNHGEHTDEVLRELAAARKEGKA
jgi:crotonobetainyl-CoA:carnitine CoA-transferase CaiB-like acyl-CoA transferase